VTTPQVADAEEATDAPPGTVTVVVPCHDYGRFLELCVTSVLRQHGVTYDVLIVDDASSDDTPGICARLAADHPGVRWIRHSVCRGHIATFNEGLAAATGDYVVLLSADDALVPGSLARAARFLDDEPGVGLVYGHPVFFAGEPLPPARRVEGTRHVRPGVDWIARRCRAGTNCISSPEVMLRRRTLEEVGLFDPDLPITGDLHLWLRIAARADVGYLAGTDQAYYRRHPSSMYRSTHHVVADLEARRAAFTTFFAGDGRHLPDAERLETDARIALADEALWKASRAYDRGRVDASPVGPLMYFAATTWPRTRDLPHARRLERRIRRGERLSRALQPFDVAAMTHRVAEHVQTSRWSRTGDL
jgi:hypothetical protein